MITDKKDLCLILDGLDLQNEEDRNLVENLRIKMFIELVVNKNGRYEKTVATNEQVDIHFAGISSILKAKKCITETLIEYKAVDHFVKIELL